jgi:hypothetical protein
MGVRVSAGDTKRGLKTSDTVRLGFDDDWCACPDRAPTHPGLAHRQTFFAIEPVDAIIAGGFALSSQQHEPPSVVESPPLGLKLAQTRPAMLRLADSVADHLAVRTIKLVGTTLRKPSGLQMRDGTALGGEP